MHFEFRTVNIFFFENIYRELIFVLCWGGVGRGVGGGVGIHNIPDQIASIFSAFTTGKSGSDRSS